jgi:hypothetical protein
MIVIEPELQSEIGIYSAVYSKPKKEDLVNFYRCVKNCAVTIGMMYCCHQLVMCIVISSIDGN